MKRPLFVIACAYLCGIAYILYGPGHTVPALLLLGAACLFCCGGALFVCRQRKKRHLHLRMNLLCPVIIWLLAAACGICRADKEAAYRASYLSVLTEGETVRGYGKLEKKENSYGEWKLYLDHVVLVRDAKNLSCNSCILYSAADAGQIGDTLIFIGKTELFETAANEGMFDQRSYYAAQKIDFAVRDAAIQKTDGGHLFLGEKLYELRSYLSQTLLLAAKRWEQLDEKRGRDDFTKNTGVILSMLLGDRSLLDRDLQTLYRTAGIAHILAISGLHVSLIGMGLYRLLRKGRLSFQNAAWPAGSMLILYAMMVGAGVSTKRAVGMLLLGLLARILGRSSDLLNSLGLVMLYLLFDNPWILGDVSFWFSCVSLIGIGIGELLLTESGGRKRDKTVFRRFGESALMGLLLYLITLPVTAFSYSEVGLYAWLLNLFVLPTVGAVIGSGLLGLLGTLFGRALAGLLSFDIMPGNCVGTLLLAPAEIILWSYRQICSFVSGLPLAVVVTGHPSWGRLVVYYLLLGVGLCWFFRKSSGPKEQRGKIAAAVAMPFLLFLILLARPSQGSRVAFLDLGQGDGIYLRTSEGFCCFIDGGSADIRNVGENRILRFLTYRGEDHVDYWFVTHADRDHISGLQEVLRSGYPVKNLVISASAGTGDEAMENLCRLAAEYGTEILCLTAGDRIQMGKDSFFCLYPDGSEPFPAFGEDDRNACSLTLLYEGENWSAFFGGDITEEAERRIAEMAEADPDLKKKLTKVNLYKASHHGSRYSNSDRILQLLKPQLAVISCGKNNSYGHPHEETLMRLQEAGSRILRTDRQGEVMIEEWRGKLYIRTYAK